MYPIIFCSAYLRTVQMIKFSIKNFFSKSDQVGIAWLQQNLIKPSKHFIISYLVVIFSLKNSPKKDF